MSLELYKLLEGRPEELDHFISAFPTQLLFRVYQVKGTSGNALNKAEYIGYAPPDALLTDAKWQVKKLIYDAAGLNTQVLFANGSAKFDKVMNSYAGFTYTET